MSDESPNIPWDAEVKKKYETMIAKIPMFHREIAKKVVDKKAVILADERQSKQVEEEDIIRAFFAEVPMTFYSLMIRLFEDVGFDYKKYEKK
ncbi:MAG: DUF2621 family protein [Candidatus Omnitrophica bacterium]|nr:DUF2621 family protein [Candidatus Omnitrophota bacterium]